jgi:hypothetical protein
MAYVLCMVWYYSKLNEFKNRARSMAPIELDETSPESWCMAIIDSSPDDRAAMRRMLLTASNRRVVFIEAETGPAPGCLTGPLTTPVKAGP